MWVVKMKKLKRKTSNENIHHNKDLAIVDAKIATVFNGKRLVKSYQSGEPLVGVIEN